ncbi:cell division protein FtsQ/DivIB [Jiella marina]|uniref:cell division protein FtsQ/DivIB n=1 Tax=Jiella sp. LLJ827 TaxID=2917712 RepID=UPI002101BBA0|nr:cell division protein FtsQ/DivIB [Jiella sp. LLJ827]MCQ0989977.1 cell division protein FtsQ/DivIB [Jiella sp. LLJ827]
MRSLMPEIEARLEAHQGPSRHRLTAIRLARRLAGIGNAAAAMRLPRFGMLALAVTSGAIAYGVVQGGHVVDVVDGVGQSFGFSIEKIDVVGNAETSEIDVLQALWETGSTTLLSLDPTAARETLEAMPWIDRVSVAKILPNRVQIEVTEHRPYAVWQTGQRFFVINREGKTIVPYAPGRFDALPVVVGEGAAATAAGLVDEMEAVPELRARVKAYIRVGSRRWDLELENGIVVRLPETEPLKALAEVVRMDRQNALLSRDIAAVDMRLDDRVVVKLTPDALARRNARLEEREKLLKRMRKDKPV